MTGAARQLNAGQLVCYTYRSNKGAQPPLLSRRRRNLPRRPGWSREASGSESRIKDAATKLARQRLNILKLAQELGSVSKACKQGGMDRTSFYEWKRRFQTHGLEGLKDLPPVPKSHPQTTPLWDKGASVYPRPRILLPTS